jgi:hypothetical protein
VADTSFAEVTDTRATPYGWIGLPISLALIIALGTLLCGAILLAVYLGFAATLGWHEVFARVINARDALKGDPKSAETAGLILGLLFYLTTAAAVLRGQMARSRSVEQLVSSDRAARVLDCRGGDHGL